MKLFNRKRKRSLPTTIYLAHGRWYESEGWTEYVDEGMVSRVPMGNEWIVDAVYTNKLVHLLPDGRGEREDIPVNWFVH